MPIEADGRQLTDEMIRLLQQLDAPNAGGNSLLDDAGWPSGVEASMPRLAVVGSASITTTGNLRLTYFTAKSATPRTSSIVTSGGTAAAATPTLVRWGIYSVAANGDLTLAAAIANDTALFATTFTPYTRALTSTWTPVVGARYALGVLVVSGAATPTISGHSALSATQCSLAPRLGGVVTGQTDLPASVANASVATSRELMYAEFS